MAGARNAGGGRPRYATPQEVAIEGLLLQHALKAQHDRAACDGVVHNNQRPRSQSLEKHGDHLDLGIRSDRNDDRSSGPDRLLVAFHPLYLHCSRAPQYEERVLLVHGGSVQLDAGPGEADTPRLCFHPERGPGSSSSPLPAPTFRDSSASFLSRKTATLTSLWRIQFSPMSN